MHFAIIAIGAIVFGGLGMFVGSFFNVYLASIFAGVIIWLGIYISLGINIVPQADFWVIERLGKFYKIKRAGIVVLCLPGLIDTIRIKETFQLQRIDLYKDEVNNKMDFKDASAAITAQVWFEVCDNDSCIFKFVYGVENPKNWLEERIDDYIRPVLQALTIDDAQEKKSQITDEVNNNLRETIKDIIGAKLESKKGLLITDIILPVEVEQLRQERLRGNVEAEKAVHIGKGYFDSINSIMEGAKKAGIPLDFESAREIYEKQRGLEAIGKTGANVTFINSDIQGLLKTFNIGKGGEK